MGLYSQGDRIFTPYPPVRTTRQAPNYAPQDQGGPVHDQIYPAFTPYTKPFGAVNTAYSSTRAPAAYTQSGVFTTITAPTYARESINTAFGPY